MCDSTYVLSSWGWVQFWKKCLLTLTVHLAVGDILLAGAMLTAGKEIALEQRFGRVLRHVCRELTLVVALRVACVHLEVLAGSAVCIGVHARVYVHLLWWMWHARNRCR